MPQRFLSPIEDVIEDARNGRMFILVDDEDRENEGDLIIPAQFATPDAVNFMARHGRGLICLTLTSDRVQYLGLPPMAQHNAMRHSTAFTVSIEAREGVTTGISAHDRSHTIAVAIGGNRGPADIASPGHVFPLEAREGGVLVRAGHTEASVDISRLAGLNPSAVICEIMKDDGTMARLPDLVEFAKEHGLKVATIRDLIAYRLRHDHMVEMVAETTYQRKSGAVWKTKVFRASSDASETVAMTLGEPSADRGTLTRMHVINPFEDFLGEDHPRTGQLERSMRIIEEAGEGVVVLFSGPMRRRPSELIQRREGVAPPPEKDNALKDYGIGAQILRDLGISKMILISNTEANIVGLEGYGLEIIDYCSIPST